MHTIYIYLKVVVDYICIQFMVTLRCCGLHMHTIYGYLKVWWITYSYNLYFLQLVVDNLINALDSTSL